MSVLGMGPSTNLVCDVISNAGRSRNVRLWVRCDAPLQTRSICSHNHVHYPYARFPSPSEMPWPNGQELRGNEVFEAVNGADKNPCVCSNQKHQCWQHLLFKWVNWNLKIDVKQKYTGSEQKLKSNDDRVLVLAVARSMCCRIFFWMHVAHADCFD